MNLKNIIRALANIVKLLVLAKGQNDRLILPSLSHTASTTKTLTALHHFPWLTAESLHVCVSLCRDI